MTDQQKPQIEGEHGSSGQKGKKLLNPFEMHIKFKSDMASLDMEVFGVGAVKFTKSLKESAIYVPRGYTKGGD